MWPTTKGGQLFWIEDGGTSQSGLVLELPRVGPRHDSNMTYGEFVEAMVGLERVRHDYTMLGIHAEIQRAGASDDLALLYFYTEEPDGELRIS